MNHLKDKKLFLLDMDGTIYLGEKLFDGTSDFLDWVRKTERRYLFLTNNSSKGVADYIGKMHRLGIPAAPGDFLTSVQVTVKFLKKHYSGRKIYVLGTRSLISELESKGILLSGPEDAEVLLMGFDTELTFGKLEAACILLNRGVDYIATHPDLVCPTEYGFVPDCGSVAQMLFNATGRMPRVLGKPEPEIVEMALELTGYEKRQALVIGDRLNTDIACGLRAGVDTALVLSGETTRSLLAKSEIKPTRVFENIGELYDTIIRPVL